MVHRTSRRLLAGLAAALLVTAACGSDDPDEAEATDGATETTEAAGEDTDTTVATDDADAAEPSGETITLGYSAWPGWFPLAVADEAGIFDDLGLDVDLRFFADYIASMDAMAAGELDGNTQTLNDTMFNVAAGSDQVIVVVNDNSTGNDAIICDESVGDSIEDLAGLTIAAEEGVVDHFLLLQGLDSVGLTQDDIDFRGALTADAAAAFAGGEYDCVGVFAPFTLTALERPGSHVVFSSADFPGVIADHIVLSRDFVESRPEDTQLLVDAWYATLDYIEANPEESVAIMAEVAGVTVEEYEDFAAGTTIFDADEALAAFADGDDITSLQFTARLINPFLVQYALTPEETDLDGLFDPSFTQDYVDRNG
jgi:NitT/TauT family transport system substrate-binding protein